MPCTEDSECGPTAMCIEFFWITRCVKRCTTTEDCRYTQGYVCYAFPSLPDDPLCVPAEIAV